MSTVYVGQGEFAASQDSNTILQTMLGSCVSTCLFDPEHGAGGLNHLVLPNTQSNSAFATVTQVNDMERLINAVLKSGALRGNLRAKVFGGARMIAGANDIGMSNARFVLEFLDAEGIPVEAQSVGGTRARRLKFWPTCGRVQQKFVLNQSLDEIALPPPPPPVMGSDLELF